MVARDGVGWAEGLGFVNRAHVFREGIGAGERAIAFLRQARQ